jgi:hypothetical protein
MVAIPAQNGDPDYLAELIKQHELDGDVETIGDIFYGAIDGVCRIAKTAAIDKIESCHSNFTRMYQQAKQHLQHPGLSDEYRAAYKKLKEGIEIFFDRYEEYYDYPKDRFKKLLIE